MSDLSDQNRKKAEVRILESITIKCKKCNGPMVRVHSFGTDSRNDTVVGYSCQDCPHYYLFH
jgi:RNase P subunit RPR2